ncbi:hypothetical protein Tco_0974292 [Tanacetum coccineum]|uniref:Uncharacterized protein n=1 Tax=Tanacetum coccineum TaxID=301880 RepID=A0ABQ5EB61_9ASTR
MDDVVENPKNPHYCNPPQFLYIDCQMEVIGEEKSYEILCKTFNHEAKAVLEIVRTEMRYDRDSDRSGSRSGSLYSAFPKHINQPDKLVFVHSNIRLISRFSESYKERPSKKWDVNLESAYLEGSASRMEDMR